MNSSITMDISEKKDQPSLSDRLSAEEIEGLVMEDTNPFRRDNLDATASPIPPTRPPRPAFENIHITNKAELLKIASKFSDFGWGGFIKATRVGSPPILNLLWELIDNSLEAKRKRKILALRRL